MHDMRVLTSELYMLQVDDIQIQLAWSEARGRVFQSTASQCSQRIRVNVTGYTIKPCFRIVRSFRGVRLFSNDITAINKKVLSRATPIGGS